MKESIINRKRIESIFFILVGTFIMTTGTIFFNIPLKIAAGGVTGFAQVINYYIPNLNIGLTMGVLNVILLLVGYMVIGKEFGLYTIIGAGSYSGFMTIFDALIDIKEPILGDNLANLILGAVLIGLGLAIVFRQNASTGGTDVLAKILEAKMGISVSKGMLIVDAFVIALAGLTFGLQSGIYAFMSLYITTWVLDNTIAGFNSKIQMVIVSKEIDNINNFIHKEINRGTTFYDARGGYTKKEQNVLVSIVDTKQYIKIRNYIDSIDDDAFVYITNINEVIGYGFSREAANNVQVRENANANN
ncbi:YitT family protein [uncultured Helcococcus sp.]|uniref:YitT family protein n=1 Tax=uncultured Helcococcus sp. TaxID=1072508 RepID=UPI002614EA48|nr:YitT family protein [uncultured Helcococcus sp.]